MRRERCEERKEDNCGEEKKKQKPLSRMMKHSGISENPEEKIWKDVRIDRVMCGCVMEMVICNHPGTDFIFKRNFNFCQKQRRLG